jgi:AAA15 family ATPase/GTPase
MIIDFSVSNYCSFDHIQTLSFRATSLDSPNDWVDQRNVINVDNVRYLKIIGVYGANASGKTNFIKAFTFFKEMVSHSVAAEGYSVNNVNPFRQSSTGMDRPSFFQMILLIEHRKYRYGFTLKNNGDIGSEWLFGPAEKNETYYFKRTGQDIQSNSEWFEEGASLPEDNLRSDALFLSFCSSYNGKISKSIKNFLERHVTIDAKITRRGLRLGGIYIGGVNSMTNRLVESGNQEMILNWLKEVGLPYNSIRIPKPDEPTPSSQVYFTKDIYDDDGNVIGETEMDLARDESEGTRKFYTFIGKLYRKFQDGGLYICDEIDSNFHPSLLQKIIELFQNPSINKANAQLLFTSHDTNLMNPQIMRRDQFYFAEKLIYGSTKMYSLADLKGIRNNADFARQYLAGIYGALPVLGDYLEEMEEDENPQNQNN